MKATEIIKRIEEKIELESNKIQTHLIKREMLEDILHMAKKDGYIEKKGTVSNA